MLVLGRHNGFFPCGSVASAAKRGLRKRHSGHGHPVAGAPMARMAVFPETPVFQCRSSRPPVLLGGAERVFHGIVEKVLTAWESLV